MSSNKLTDNLIDIKSSNEVSKAIPIPYPTNVNARVMDDAKTASMVYMFCVCVVLI